MDKKAKILIVEDEKDIRDLMTLHLSREGHNVQTIADGEGALERLNQNVYDLIVLDWMLPASSGLDICKKVRAGNGTRHPKNVPILMVTARANTADIVVGLEMGADDYLSKPFDIPVLVARVRALLRRAEHSQEKEATRAEIGGLTLDRERFRVECEGEEIVLTPSEFRLLSALMSNEGRVLTRERLIDLVQGEGVVVTDRAIDTHVFGLRKKLGGCSDVIETVRGVGYRVKSQTA